MSTLRYSTLETPHGTVWFAAGEEGLRFLLLRYFNDRRVVQELRKARGAKLVRDDRALRSFAAQLRSYFEGRECRSTSSSTCPRALAFSRRCGGRPGGSVREPCLIQAHSPRGRQRFCARAGGQRACGEPDSDRRPCHRIIRIDGALGGFTGVSDGRRSSSSWSSAREASTSLSEARRGLKAARRPTKGHDHEATAWTTRGSARRNGSQHERHRLEEDDSRPRSTPTVTSWGARPQGTERS